MKTVYNGDEVRIKCLYAYSILYDTGVITNIRAMDGEFSVLHSEYNLYGDDTMVVRAHTMLDIRGRLRRIVVYTDMESTEVDILRIKQLIAMKDF